MTTTLPVERHLSNRERVAAVSDAENDAVAEFVSQVRYAVEDSYGDSIGWDDTFRGGKVHITLTGFDDWAISEVEDYLTKHGFRVKDSGWIPTKRDRYGAPEDAYLQMELVGSDRDILKSRDVAAMAQEMAAGTYRDESFRVRFAASKRLTPLQRLAKIALDHPELRPDLMPIIRGATRKPETTDIYPHKIDHGWDEPLSGGTDVMRRLQNQLRKEQGLPERPASPEIPKRGSERVATNVDEPILLAERAVLEAIAPKGWVGKSRLKTLMDNLGKMYDNFMARVHPDLAIHSMLGDGLVEWQGSRLVWVGPHSAAEELQRRPRVKIMRRAAVQTGALRKPYYELADGVTGFRDAVSDDPLLARDSRLRVLVNDLDGVLDDIRKHINKNYIWD